MAIVRAETHRLEGLMKENNSTEGANAVREIYRADAVIRRVSNFTVKVQRGINLTYPKSNC